MRLIYQLFTLIALTTGTSWGESWVSEYDSLLQRYVTVKGVDYQTWHQSKMDRAALSSVIRGISRQNPNALSSDDKLAFYLNAYNAWILHRILESYPTKGPGGGGFIGRTRFFRSKSLNVAKQTTSFHLLENEIIRPQFSEPRIHFALNCASKSCPPLHNRAFRGETLSKTLEKLTRRFINDNPLGIRSTDRKEIQISKIFDWYEADFGGTEGVLEFINRYRERPFPQKTKIRYQEYQWTLNQSKN